MTLPMQADYYGKLQCKGLRSSTNNNVLKCTDSLTLQGGRGCRSITVSVALTGLAAAERHRLTPIRNTQKEIFILKDLD